MAIPRILSVPLLALIGMTTLACSTPEPIYSNGTLYIVGGGPQTEEMVKEFITLAGGAGQATIAVLAMASVNGEQSGAEKAASLRELGASAFDIWVDRQGADLDSVVGLLDSVSGIWFGGGDQNRLADVLRGSALERAIKERYSNGAVIGGTSAGAAVLSSVMITGTELKPGGSRPDSTLDWVTIESGDVETVEGLHYVANAVIDQHFVRRKRHNRLLSLVLESEPHLGAGIDESTALLVQPNGMWQVSGESVVVIYDARNAPKSISDRGKLGASNVAMHILPAGSQFNPLTGEASLTGTAKN